MFSELVTVNSKVDTDVEYSLYENWNETRRMRLELAQSDPLDRLSACRDEYIELIKEFGMPEDGDADAEFKKLDDKTKAEFNRRAGVLDRRMRAIDILELRPEYFNLGLCEVFVGEDTLTGSQFIKQAPEDLIEEAYDLIIERAVVTPAESKNSESPSTSGAPEGEKKTGSSAPSAK